jgi:hypothetical protein
MVLDDFENVWARDPVGHRQPAFRRSTLAGLETALHLIDHVNPALAANQTVGAMAATKRFQRITDFHGTILNILKGRARQAERSKNGILPAGRRLPGTGGF